AVQSGSRHVPDHARRGARALHRERFVARDTARGAVESRRAVSRTRWRIVGDAPGASCYSATQMRAVWTLLLTAVVAMGAVRAHHRLRRFQHGATLTASTSGAHHHVRAHRVPVVVAAPAEQPRIDASIAAVAVAPI